jgi:DNA-binding response OmpR family regulator
MTTPGSVRVLAVVRALRGSVLQVLDRLDELERAASQLASGPAERGGGVGQTLVVDRAMYCVVWRQKRRRMGCSYPFRFLERLASRPDRYVPIADLEAAIWHGSRSRSAIRSAVCDLRRRLADAGMVDLADRIDGQTAGHYALLLSRGD